MIRLAKHTDTVKLKSLWLRCFDDTPLYVERFFDRCFDPNNTLVVEDNQEIVSVVYLLEGTIIRPSEPLLIYYLYACATTPNRQGEGLMGLLLNRAFEVANERNRWALTLIAEEPSLIDYYTRFGFTTLPPTKTFTIQGTLNQEDTTIRPYPLNATLLHEIRERSHRNRGVVSWSESHYQLLLDDIINCGGAAVGFVSEKGTDYLLYYPINGGVKVIEWDLKRANFPIEEIESPRRGMIRLCNGTTWNPDEYSIFLNLGLSD